MGAAVPDFLLLFSALNERIHKAVAALRKGEMLLIGDDGIRENEVDLVFHASTATAQQVNFAISRARGLLCVSVGHREADSLGFASAPRLPGAMAHTGFTLSVDARRGITSGISASDRAKTMRAMAAPDAQPCDFISPGHVFPVMASAHGLLARTGHTEAVADLCLLAGLRPVAAMCEVLGDEGEALPPSQLQNAATHWGSTQSPAWHQLPYLSTVDLLWFKVFGAQFSWLQESVFEPVHGVTWGPLITQGHKNAQLFMLTSDAHQGMGNLTFPAAWAISPDFLLPHSDTSQRPVQGHPRLNPECIRIVGYDGGGERDNGVDASQAQATLYLAGLVHLWQPLWGGLSDFCDLSQKVGLARTQPGVRRCFTLLQSLKFLHDRVACQLSFADFLKAVPLSNQADKDFLYLSQTQLLLPE